MLEKIAALEQLARPLEPNRAGRDEILGASVAYVHEFLESLPEQSGYAQIECPELRALAVGEAGKPFGQMLDILASEVNRAGINPASGRHLGYIPNGGIWSASVADMLAAATNRNAGVFFSGQGAVVLENQVIKWLCEVFGYPDSAHGTLLSGGSVATLTALVAARDAHKIGSENVRRSVVYGTGQAHHCIQKALHIAGLGEAIFREISVDERFRMDVAWLETALLADKAAGLQPFLVVGTAGITNTGAIDPLDSIADLCHEHGAWFHVDAAYGGFFVLVESLREKFQGIERSDSLVVDPHKGLFLPYGLGVALVREGQRLVDSFGHQSSSYLVDAQGFGELSPSDCGPELTRHFRGLRLWLPLHLHGVAPFRACLEEKIWLCRYFHERIQALGFEVGPEPELSVTFYRWPAADPDAFNLCLVESLHRDGRVFFASTRLNGAVWLRCAVLSFRTHLREIELGLAMLTEHVARLENTAENREKNLA